MPHYFRLLDRLLVALLLMIAVPVVFQLVPQLWVWRLLLVGAALLLVRVTARLVLSRRERAESRKETG
jgi:energy-converting hydrogenase Eha subunit G